MPELKFFLDNLEKRMAPAEEALRSLQWEFANTGNPSLHPKIVEKEMQLHSIFSNKSDFEKVKNWLKDPQLDTETRRSLQHLYRLFLASQEPEEVAKKKAELDAKITGHFANFRSTIKDKVLSVNDIQHLLQTSDHSKERKEVWEASKQIGPIVKDLILEKVLLCNQLAQDLGFSNYYEMQLELQEIKPNDLQRYMEELDRITSKRFEEKKHLLDMKLVKRFGLQEVKNLRPWHYSDPFFQEAPPLTELNLDPLFLRKNLEELTVKTFDRVGLDIRMTLKQSDLYERPGKDQHAFCLMIGRQPDKVKILCNCRDNSYWMSTMLHEFGHAVYDQFLDRDQSYFLRDIAHINTTEAIAMLFGRLTHNKNWLKEVLGLEAEQASTIASLAQKELSWHMLVFSRWVLVMYHFEKALYENPLQDLNLLWWDLVEKYQGLTRPENRNQPDWATKIHLALHPVYYHNYLLGEMTASQIQHYIEKKLGDLPLIEQPKTGPWLKEKLFKQGAIRPWQEALEYLTGEKLNPHYFANEFGL